jgi:hypothetical protein
MTDTRVRILITIACSEQFFVRFINDPRTGGVGLFPETVTGDKIRTAALLSRDRAIEVCRVLRAADWNARVVRPDGVVLYEEETAPPQQKPKSAERLTHRAGSILIVPGAVRGFYIRFPNRPIESIYGDTPQECYDKLVAHPEFAELSQFAEQYVPAPEPVVPPETAPVSRLRPGSRR